MRRSALPFLVLALTTAACSGVIGDPNDVDNPGGDPGGPGGTPTEQALPGPRIRRLLARQYRNSVRDLLGDAAAAAVVPPSDTDVNGFESIGASQIAVGDDAVSKYEGSSLAAAAVAMGDKARIDAYVDCAPSSADDAGCHSKFVANFGRLAWRRPLVQEEIDRYTSIGVDAATAYSDFNAGISHSMAAMLQSPYFVYQIELGSMDPQNIQVRKLTGYEIASRISYFLLDTTPSNDLLKQAESGALDTADGVRTAARSMLEQPAARDALRGYYDEFLRLRELNSLPKDAGTYPAWGDSLAAAMREETMMLIEEIVWDKDSDYREFFDADHTFVNPELAAFYGVDAPSPDGFASTTLPADQKRGGYFGQASFLSTFAHAAATSPTLRGKFVRTRMLCQDIPAPPPGVVTVLPSDDQAKTMRDKLSAHQKNPSCASCHTKMDNIGLGLENYDGVGSYRTMENGVAIDTSSDVDGVPFDGAASLGKALRDNPDVSSCLVRNLYRHASGHVETAGEDKAMTDIESAFVTSGYRLKEALVEIVASEAFRSAGPLEL